MPKPEPASGSRAEPGGEALANCPSLASKSALHKGFSTLFCGLGNGVGESPHPVWEGEGRGVNPLFVGVKSDLRSSAPAKLYRLRNSICVMTYVEMPDGISGDGIRLPETKAKSHASFKGQGDPTK